MFKFKTPACVSRLNLEKDNQVIVDLCGSPAEPDAIALCKQNGVVQLISNLYEKSPKVVSKQMDAYCRMFFIKVVSMF
jgi:hypothetical protein